MACQEASVLAAQLPKRSSEMLPTWHPRFPLGYKGFIGEPKGKTKSSWVQIPNETYLKSMASPRAKARLVRSLDNH